MCDAVNLIFKWENQITYFIRSITVKYKIIYIGHYFENHLSTNMKEATQLNYLPSLVSRKVNNERTINKNHNINT